ncbi:hypothetical protein HETIRDRAFT_332376, partial [Heterobasidion irregulare TC 32-1]
LYKTEVYSLPAININELFISGNTKVINAILKELKIDILTTKFMQEIKLMVEDQLSLT